MNQPTLERRRSVRRYPTELSPAMQYAFSRWLPLCGRVLLASLFLVSAFRIITGWDAAIAYATTQGFARAEFWTGVTLAIDLVFGVALAVGFYTRVAALCLAVYLLGLTFMGHAYWTYAGTEYAMHLTYFMKNLAIIGGLLVVGSYGPGRVGFDNASDTEPLPEPLGPEPVRRLEPYNEKEI